MEMRGEATEQIFDSKKSKYEYTLLIASFNRGRKRMRRMNKIYRRER
jgi:hypothetical protein